MVLEQISQLESTDNLDQGSNYRRWSRWTDDGLPAGTEVRKFLPNHSV